MATYRELHGKAVKTVTTNPSDDAAEGQIWFNSTDNTFKSVVTLQAWSSSGPLITARQALAGFGTQTAAVACGGDQPPQTNKTEEYNGTGWTSSTNYPLSIKHNVGCGTETAGLVCGGNALPGPAYTDVTNEYDGSSWTSGGSLAQGPLGIHALFGTQTAAVQASGYGRPPNPGSNTPTAEEYNGTSWTASNAVNTARRAHSGGGAQTAGLIAGGFTTARVANSEEYNGTSFSEGNDINTARSAFTQCGGTTEANSWICGGTTAPGAYSTATEYYDGTSWTNQTATLAAGRNSGAAGGIQNTAVVFGGQNPSTTGATEELNQSAAVITAAAWASGGALGTGRNLGGSACSSQTSGIVFGGSPYTGKTESYNGTSWSELNDMVLGRSYIAGFGTATAAVGAGGYLTSPSPGSPGNMKSEVEEWDGSSWSEQTNLPGARLSAGSCGTQTAGLLFGGATSQPFNPTIQTGTFEYDGSSWTAGGALPEAKAQANSGGIQTAAFFASGRTVPGSRSTKTAFYNGTAWSEGADVVSVSPGTGNTGATGTTSAGQATSDANLTNNYDGTAWATAPNYSTARGRGMGGGTQTSNIYAGGYSPSSPNFRTDTEEFTGETTSLNIETLTQS